MSTLITSQHIRNFRNADKVSLKARSINFNNETLKSYSDGTFTIHTHNNHVDTTITTYGFPFMIDYQIVINGQPISDISESIVEVTFAGNECHFLGYLLKPNDELTFDVVIDNILPVITASVFVGVYRGGDFLCKVQLPTIFCQKLGDVLMYERR